MSTDALATLAHLRDFLTRDVLPALPHSQRSELRSAVKLLEDTEREFDALPFRMSSEALRLLDLCDRAGVAAREDEAAVRKRLSRLRERLSEVRRLRELMDVHREVREQTSSTLTALLRQQEETTEPDPVVEAAIGTFLDELRGQAAARRSWQSVFVSSDSKVNGPEGNP